MLMVLALHVVERLRMRLIRRNHATIKYCSYDDVAFVSYAYILHGMNKIV